jgi:hypothetical protein
MAPANLLGRKMLDLVSAGDGRMQVFGAAWLPDILPSILGEWHHRPSLCARSERCGTCGCTKRKLQEVSTLHLVSPFPGRSHSGKSRCNEMNRAVRFAGAQR